MSEVWQIKQEGPQKAVPLRTIKSPAVIKALVKFCTTFGLPKVIQTDQGSNITSKKFTQILTEMGVSHRMSSAYHSESQGALERYHQTLRTMIRANCVETGKEWDEGLSFLLFFTRENQPGLVLLTLGLATLLVARCKC